MAHFVLYLQAYDCQETVQWIVRIRDYDSLEEGPQAGLTALSGAMQGRGSADPTRWLRELLEGVREAL